MSKQKKSCPTDVIYATVLPSERCSVDFRDSSGKLLASVGIIARVPVDVGIEVSLSNVSLKPDTLF